jgi:hypothetical protein
MMNVGNYTGEDSQLSVAGYSGLLASLPRSGNAAYDNSFAGGLLACRTPVGAQESASRAAL